MMNLIFSIPLERSEFLENIQPLTYSSNLSLGITTEMTHIRSVKVIQDIHHDPEKRGKDEFLSIKGEIRYQDPRSLKEISKGFKYKNENDIREIKEVIDSRDRSLRTGDEYSYNFEYAELEINFKNKKIIASSRSGRSKIEVGRIIDTYSLPFKKFAHILYKDKSRIVKRYLVSKAHFAESPVSANYWFHIVCTDIPDDLVLSYLALTKNRGDISIFSNYKKTICISLFGGLLIISPRYNLREELLDSRDKKQEGIDKAIKKAYSKVRSANRLSLPIKRIKKAMKSFKIHQFDFRLYRLIRLLFAYIDSDNKKFVSANVSSFKISKDVTNFTISTMDTIENIIRYHMIHILIYDSAELLNSFFGSKCKAKIHDMGKDPLFSTRFFDKVINGEYMSSFASMFKL